MNKYVAFLRGINVGGNNLIKMDVLRQEFEKMGFESVRTYIQSGNVLFGSDMTNKNTIEEIISAALAVLFKGKIKVLVRSQKDLAKTIAHFLYNSSAQDAFLIQFVGNIIYSKKPG